MTLDEWGGAEPLQTAAGAGEDLTAALSGSRVLGKKTSLNSCIALQYEANMEVNFVKK